MSFYKALFREEREGVMGHDTYGYFKRIPQHFLESLTMEVSRDDIN